MIGVLQIMEIQNFQNFLTKTHTLIQKYKIEYLLFGHLGDCHLHFHLIPKKNQQKNALDVYKKIISYCSKLGGVYSAEHGTGKRKRSDFIECFGNSAVKQLKLCKNTIDPNSLLNRGNIFV